MDVLRVETAIFRNLMLEVIQVTRTEWSGTVLEGRDHRGSLEATGQGWDARVPAEALSVPGGLS